jgi:hypothetical protein
LSPPQAAAKKKDVDAARKALAQLQVCESV